MDSSNTKEIMCILKEINEKYKTTVLVVTHNNLVCNISDRILRIVDGKIVLDKVNQQPADPASIDWTGSEEGM